MNTSLTLPLWTHVLVAIHNSPEKIRYCEKLNRKVRASRSHIRTIVGMLRAKGMLTLEKNGKTKRVNLTEDGSNLAVHMQEVQLCLRRCSQ